jgi:DNA-binding PadR family transcriptional regulator
LTDKGRAEVTRLLQTTPFRVTGEQAVVALLLSDPNRVWTIRQLIEAKNTPGNVYKLLIQLSELGWLWHGEQKVEGRNSQVYKLSEQGWQEAPQWLADQQP